MRSSCRSFVVLQLSVLAFSLLGISASGNAEEAERILAVVDGMPVLLSEARLLRRLAGKDLEAAREALVDELLMHREAARLPQAAVSPEEVSRMAADLERRHPGLAGEAGDQGLARLARRQATILRYIAFRFKPQIRVDDEDVLREWRADRGGTESPTVADLQPVRERLEERQLNTRVEAWVAELRAEARLRYNPSSGPTR